MLTHTSSTAAFVTALMDGWSELEAGQIYDACTALDRAEMCAAQDPMYGGWELVYARGLIADRRGDVETAATLLQEAVALCKSFISSGMGDDSYTVRTGTVWVEG